MFELHIFKPLWRFQGEKFVCEIFWRTVICCYTKNNFDISFFYVLIDIANNYNLYAFYIIAEFLFSYVGFFDFLSGNSGKHQGLYAAVPSTLTSNVLVQGVSTISS